MSDLIGYLITGLGLGAGFALVASGLVAIYRVTRVVNFAQGAFAVLAAMLTSTLLTAGLPHGLAEFGGVLLGALAGLLVGIVAIGRPGTTPGTSLIVTLGVGVFAYAVEILIWGDQPRSFPGVSGVAELGGARLQAHYLVILAVTVPVFAALAWFFARTDLGKALSACASNRYAAQVVGIDVRRMGLVAFALGGALGGLAGVLTTPVQQVTFDSDVALIVNGFAAAVLGGLTRPVVALAGGLLLGVAQTLVAGYGGGAYQVEVALVLMLTVMIVQAARTGPVAEAARRSRPAGPRPGAHRAGARGGCRRTPRHARRGRRRGTVAPRPRGTRRRRIARPLTPRPAPEELLLSVLGRGAAPSLHDLREDDWTALDEAAVRHDVAPLLWHRLEERGAASLAPPAVRKRLGDAHIVAGLRAEAQRRQLAEILAALGARDVPVVPLKGAHLAAHAYPTPALRPMGDLDLLVPESRLETAMDAVADAGYARPGEEERAAYRNHRHPPPLRRAGRLPVELHYTIEPCAPPFTLPLADVWARTRPAATAGVDVLALAPEDLLLHLATHMGRSRLLGTSLVRIYDVAMWTERFGASADWDAVVRRAAESEAQRFVYAALGLASRLLAAEVPPEALAALRSASADEAIERAAGLLSAPAEVVAGTLALTLPGDAAWSRLMRLVRALLGAAPRADRPADRQASAAARRRARQRAGWRRIAQLVRSAPARRAIVRQIAWTRGLRDWAEEEE
jgi:branched-chain amino acid transport system permease protein